MFDWGASNREHLQPHGVEPEEAEEAVLDPHRLPRDAYSVAGERQKALLGATQTGDILFVAFTMRQGRPRVVSARPADDTEKRRYRRRRK